MQSGRLFVLSGPSGTGKGTICKELIKDGTADLSVSMTTRAPRTGEIEGVSYYFVTREEYDRTIAEDGFLEHAEIYGNCYGTPKAPVLEKLAKGRDVILEIEMQGAVNVKKAYPDAVLIFVLPPSLKVLKDRLTGRGTESEEQLQKRTVQALSEIHRIFEYDYSVINDDLQTAVEDVKAIMKAEHFKVNAETAFLVKKYEEEE